jgi:hypothetical protein
MEKVNGGNEGARTPTIRAPAASGRCQADPIEASRISVHFVAPFLRF